MKYTVPAFNPTDAGTIAASVIPIPAAQVLRGLRVTGANLVFLHSSPPTTSGQHLDGWPLGPNADEPLLGEALPLAANSGALTKLYVTAVAASEVRTLTLD